MGTLKQRPNQSRDHASFNPKKHAVMLSVGRRQRHSDPRWDSDRPGETESNGADHDFSRILVHSKSPRGLQAKLTTNSPGDAYEREADRVSEEVMRSRDSQLQPACACGGSCSNCQSEQAGKRSERLQTALSSVPGGPPLPGIVQEVLRSEGQPLGLAARTFMESRLGHGFSDVRVHTGGIAETSARSIGARAYTVGNHIVFGSSFDSNTATGRRLLAHELTHVVQQSDGRGSAAGGGGVVQRKEAQQAQAKASACHTGCAQRWGQDTTCSLWGFHQGAHEREPESLIDVKNRKIVLTPCCNTWPFSVEKFARDKLGLAGAASCPAQHQKEIATVSFGGKEVSVLCSDTIPGKNFGYQANAAACQGKISREVIEMSPKAMQDLSGQVGNALHVTVCFSGSQQDLCRYSGPNARVSPEVEDCLAEGCTVPPGTPRLKNTGWPRA